MIARTRNDNPSLLTMLFRAMNLGGPNTVEFGLNSPDAREFLVGSAPTPAGVSVTSRTALKYPPWWRAVNLISSDVAKIPLHLYKSDQSNRKRAIEHPGYPLLRRKPNDNQTAGVFKKALQFHALQWGNGYAWIERDGGARPLNMTLLSPTDTYPVLTTKGLWYVTTVNGEMIKFTARDIFHIKGLSFDGLVGYSVIDLMADALGLGIAAREYGSRFYGQGSNASGILMIPGNPDKDKARMIMKEWNEMATSLTRSHKVALLHGGVTWQQTTIDPQKAQAIETREFEIREVANITGIPPHKLGDKTRTSYNSLENENQSYLDQCLDHWLVMWEEEAGDKLLTEQEKAEDSHYYEFNRPALLKTDIKTRFEVYNIARMIGVYSANDIRRKENEDPIGAQGDIYLVPANMWNAQDVADGKHTPVAADAIPASQVNDLKAKLSRRTNNCKKLLRDLKSLKAQKATWTAAYSESQVSVAKLTAEVSAKEDVRAVLQALLDERTTLLNSVTGANRKLKAQIAQATSQFNAAKAELNDTISARDAIQSKLDELNEDRKDIATQLASSRQEVATLRQSIIDSVRVPFRNMLSDRLERLRAVEDKQVRDAAARGGNFIKWYEGWYTQHRDKMCDALAPSAKVWYSLLEMSGSTTNVPALVDRYIADSQSALLEACNGTALELVTNVENLLNAWGTGRIELLADNLMGEK